jgi:hypothetical protein
VATIIFLVRLPGTKARNERRIAAGNRRRMSMTQEVTQRPIAIEMEEFTGSQPREPLSSALARKSAQLGAEESLTAVPALLNSYFALPGTVLLTYSE